jgi:hypothetical protein
VQEADDIAVSFLAIQNPEAVEAYTGQLALLVTPATTEPGATATLAEQRPALFDYRRQGLGCTRQ